MSKKSRTEIQRRDLHLVRGIDRHLASAGNVHLAGKTYRVATVRVMIMGRVRAAERIRRARAELLEAIHGYETIDPEVTAVTRDLRTLVVARFGPGDAETLGDFGYPPSRPGGRTPEAEAAAAEKARTTRAARRAAAG